MSQTDTSPQYKQAKARIEKKRRFRGELVGYVVVNAFFVVVWAVTGRGYFWPGWILGVSGVFLILSARDLFFRREVTDEEIQRELHKQR